jgi:hypothetical protein
MATVASPAPARHNACTTQERRVLGQPACIVGSLDYWRGRCADLEHRLALCPEGPRRHHLIRDLFAPRQGEQAAILDLRAGVSHLTGLVILVYAEAV